MSKKRKYGAGAVVPAKLETPATVVSTAPIKKGEGEGGDDEEEDDEDEDEEDDKVDKADLALQDLEKGLAEMEAAGKAAPKSRKDELLEKARKMRLTERERQELDAELDGRLRKGLEQQEDLVKGMDVSPALDVLATKVSEAVDRLADKIDHQQVQSGEFNQALTKSLVAMGSVVKAQQEQIDAMRADLEKALDGPAREPKAATPTNTPAKPEPAAAPAKTNLRQWAPVLERMHVASRETGRHGYSASGILIRDEIAKALSGEQLDPRIVKDAENFAKAAR